jgi:tRNA nucleotidyltransferase (CCA-adding enzyme)
MKPYAMWRGGAGENAVRRLAAEVVRIDRLVRVAAADDGGRPPFPSNPEPMQWLMAEAERLRIKDSAPKPIVQGRHLIAMGLKPGVKFGEILKSCYEAQLDGDFETLDGGLEFCRTLTGI